MADRIYPKAGRFTSYENVYDFIEFKVLRDAETLADAGHADAATKLLDLLDKYLLHELDIFYQDGLPWYTVPQPEANEASGSIDVDVTNEND